MSKDLLVKDWGTQRIDLTYKGSAAELRPTEIHHKSDGTIEGGPSLAIVMEIPVEADLPIVIGQISITMLKDALQQLGYVLKEPELRVWRWWVGIDELPRYVKLNPTNTVGVQRVVRLKELREEAGRIWIVTDDPTVGYRGNIEAEYLLPATFEEYQQFMNAEAV